MYHRNIIDSQDILITVPDSSLQEHGEIGNEYIEKLNTNKPVDNDALFHLKAVSLPTKISNQNTPVIYIACEGFNGTILNIFSRENNSNKGLLTYKQFHILGSINLTDIPDWRTLRTYDDRISISLAHNSTDYNSDFFPLRTFFDLQNVKLFLIDEKGDRITYGNNTTKRPHYTLSIDYYDTKNRKRKR